MVRSFPHMTRPRWVGRYSRWHGLSEMYDCRWWFSHRILWPPYVVHIHIENASAPMMVAPQFPGEYFWRSDSFFCFFFFCVTHKQHTQHALFLRWFLFLTIEFTFGVFCLFIVCYGGSLTVTGHVCHRTHLSNECCWSVLLHAGIPIAMWRYTHTDTQRDAYLHVANGHTINRCVLYELIAPKPANPHTHTTHTLTIAHAYPRHTDKEAHACISYVWCVRSRRTIPTNSEYMKYISMC